MKTSRQKEMMFNAPLPRNTKSLVKNYSLYLFEVFIIVKNLLKSTTL